MSIIQVKVRSQELQSKTDVVVILPTPSLEALKEMPDYAFYLQEKKYPVLYLYHGTAGDCWDWLRFSQIDSYARKHNLAVVMPSVQNSSMHNIPHSYAYYNYAAKELPTIMEWMFPISSRRENKFIAGLSMGGYGALKLALMETSTFSAVGCFSSAFDLPKWIEADRTILHAAAFDPAQPLTGTQDDVFWLVESTWSSGESCPRLYISCGRDDTLCWESNQTMRRHLDALGIPYTWHDQPGGHDWDFWDDEIRRFLLWIAEE